MMESDEYKVQLIKMIEFYSVVFFRSRFACRDSVFTSEMDYKQVHYSMNSRARRPLHHGLIMLPT